jgi:PPM family protein phosphatase
VSTKKSDENPTRLKVKVACHTDKGRVREGNEDAFIIFELDEADISKRISELADRPVGSHGLLLAVADGIGGAQAGEVASQLAVEQLARRLTAPARSDEPTERLSDGLKSANHAIRHAAQENFNYLGMGSTVTAALIHEGQAIIGQVGDSRCYLIRGEEARQVTKDQSLVQVLVEAGKLTEDEAAHSSQRHVILQALGLLDDIEPEVTALRLEPKDYLLLCSDYLGNAISAKEMLDIIRKTEAPDAACAELVALANERGGEDNSTVLIARFDVG